MASPAGPDALGPTLVEIVREGAERGEDAHSALKRAGVIGGPLWDRIVQA